jgi:hypothetical protein
MGRLAGYRGETRVGKRKQVSLGYGKVTMSGSENRTEVSIFYRPIGVIHSAFENIENMPIQPTAAIGIRGTVKVSTDFIARGRQG